MTHETEALIARLERINLWKTPTGAPVNPDGPLAAATIREQAAEIERLRESNRLMGDVIDYACTENSESDGIDFLDLYREEMWQRSRRFLAYRARQARKALGEQP